MRRRIVFVIGNICSGKTTYCQNFMSKNGGYRYFPIDHYRQTYNFNGTFDGEDKAIAKWKDAIMKSRDAVIECSGVSSTFKWLYNTLKSDESNDVQIHLVPSPKLEVMIERYNKRTTKIPFPYNSRIEDSIAYIEEGLKKYSI